MEVFAIIACLLGAGFTLYGFNIREARKEKQKEEELESAKEGTLLASMIDLTNLTGKIMKEIETDETFTHEEELAVKAAFIQLRQEYKIKISKTLKTHGKEKV